MGEALTWKAVGNGSTGHCAVRAWASVRPLTEITSVAQCLDARGRERPNSAVWRLRVADGGADVLAKLARRQAVSAEVAVYESVLRKVCVTAPDLLGWSRHGAEDDRAWLFLRFLPGSRADLHDPVQRVMLSQWLATVHGSTRHLDRPTDVPPQRWADYDERRAQALAAIDEAGRTAPGPDVEADLRACVQVLERLDARWDDVKTAGRTTPCLVHGDVISKNVLVDGEQLCLVDWERCSWGSPAEDLADVDLATYRQVLGVGDVDLLRHLQLSGGVLRDLCLLAATAAGLGEWPRRPASRMALYASRMDAQLAVL